MPITTALANQIANATLRNQSYTSPANHYAALYSTTVAADGTGTEITGNGYSRQSVTFSAPSGGVAASNVAVTFSCTGNAWPLVKGFAVLDASTSGNMMYYQNITARNVKVGDDVVFASGDITLSIT